MTEKKKRDKVTAELSVAHLLEFAGEIGQELSREEAVAFLNRDGHAYEMWQRMMHAAEDYIKSALQRQVPAPHAMSRPATTTRCSIM